MDKNVIAKKEIQHIIDNATCKSLAKWQSIKMCIDLLDLTWINFDWSNRNYVHNW